MLKTYRCPRCGSLHPSSAFVCFGQDAPAPHRATCVEPVKLRKRTVFEPCEHHAAMYATETRYRCAETMVEGGWASSPCPRESCKMRPGTDFFTAEFVTANPTYTVGKVA
jgi:hypothetical protein